MSSYGFALSGSLEFRDALALRYHRSIVALPAMCDGCGEPTSVDHALNCRKGGLVIKRHNEVRDTLGELLALAFGNQIIKQPVIKEADPETNEQGLIADLAVIGVCGGHSLKHYWIYVSWTLMQTRTVIALLLQ